MIFLTLLSERHHSFTRFLAPAWERTLWKLCFPDGCIRSTHSISPRSRRDGLQVSAGRQSRALGTLVPKLELWERRSKTSGVHREVSFFLVSTAPHNANRLASKGCDILLGLLEFIRLL